MFGLGVAPRATNVLGARLAMFLGEIGHDIGSSAAVLSRTSGSWPAVAGGELLGVGAALLWTAQGRLMLEYAGGDDVGRIFAIFWSMFLAASARRRARLRARDRGTRRRRRALRDLHRPSSTPAATKSLRPAAECARRGTPPAPIGRRAARPAPPRPERATRPARPRCASATLALESASRRGPRSARGGCTRATTSRTSSSVRQPRRGAGRRSRRGARARVLGEGASSRAVPSRARSCPSRARVSAQDAGRGRARRARDSRRHLCRIRRGPPAADRLRAIHGRYAARPRAPSRARAAFSAERGAPRAPRDHRLGVRRRAPIGRRGARARKTARGRAARQQSASSLALFAALTAAGPTGSALATAVAPRGTPRAARSRDRRPAARTRRLGVGTALPRRPQTAPTRRRCSVELGGDPGRTIRLEAWLHPRREWARGGAGATRSRLRRRGLGGARRVAGGRHAAASVCSWEAL